MAFETCADFSFSTRSARKLEVRPWFPPHVGDVYFVLRPFLGAREEVMEYGASAGAAGGG